MVSGAEKKTGVKATTVLAHLTLFHRAKPPCIPPTPPTPPWLLSTAGPASWQQFFQAASCTRGLSKTSHRFLVLRHGHR